MGHQVLRRLRHGQQLRPGRERLLRVVHADGPRGPLRQPRPVVPDLRPADHRGRRFRGREGHREAQQGPHARPVRAADRHMRLHAHDPGDLRRTGVLPRPGLRQALVLHAGGRRQPAVLLPLDRHGHQHSLRILHEEAGQHREVGLHRGPDRHQRRVPLRTHDRPRLRAVLRQLRGDDQRVRCSPR